MSHSSTAFWRLWAVLLALPGLAALAGCPSDSGSARLTTAMGPDAAKAFGVLVGDYNKAHASSPITWTNVASEAAMASDASTDWVIVSAATARQLAARQSFTGDVSPKLTAGLLKGFHDLRRTAVDESLFPMLGRLPVFIADSAAVESVVGGMPITIGDMLKQASVHRRKVGRFLFSPSFGDSEVVLRFIWSQGATVVGPKGDPVFPAGELAGLLTPWVERFRAGDLPKACFEWDQVAAARQMLAGNSNIVLGDEAAVTEVANRPDKKSRRFNFFRAATGVVEDQWMEPIGLMHLRPGGVSLAAQNMIAFLLSPKALGTLADGYQAVPLVEEVRANHAIVGRTPAIEAYLASASLFAVEGVPLMPMEAHRSELADAVRMALKDAVDGMPVDQTVNKAQAWYQKSVSGT